MSLPVAYWLEHPTHGCTECHYKQNYLYFLKFMFKLFVSVSLLFSLLNICLIISDVLMLQLGKVIYQIKIIKKMYRMSRF